MNPEDEALICAEASAIIYDTNNDDPGSRASSEATMAKWGFENFSWINLTSVFEDVCAFVATSNDYHLLVFRGTKVPQDWMTDLACTPVRFDWVFQAAPAIGEIHAGFGHCLADGLARILEALAPRDPAIPLLITGHSLGGALAALSGAYFSVQGSSVPSVSSIYTFGQPRIGLHDFCNTYSRILANKLVRFVNNRDLVPRVPFRGWDYSDEGTMIHFDSTETPALQSMEWQSFLARTLQSLEDFVEILAHIKIDIGDHSMTGYRDLIVNKKAALAPLLQPKN